MTRGMKPSARLPRARCHMSCSTSTSASSFLAGRRTATASRSRGSIRDTFRASRLLATCPPLTGEATQVRRRRSQQMPAPADTTWTVANGSLAGADGGGKQLRLRCENEIVLCTQRSGNTLTVKRAWNSTAASAHAAGAAGADRLDSRRGQGDGGSVLRHLPDRWHLLRR